MEFLLKIVIFLKPLTIFAKDSILDVWKSSEYASDSILNFILKYIPVIYITSLIFLCANDKLVITEYTGIDSWVQSWVSWAEPGLPRKPSS